MDSELIVEQLEVAQQALSEQGSWFDFVSRIDRLLEGLGLLAHQQGDPLQAAIDLNRTLLQYWSRLAGRNSGLLLAECYGLCKSPAALQAGMPVLRDLWGMKNSQPDLRERAWQGRSVARGYLASLALLDGQFPNEGFGQLLVDAAETGRSRYVGIYLGCPVGPWVDINDWNEHWIIEMTTRNCEKNTVANFKSHGTFWGFYAAHLTDVQREGLLGLADSFIGICTYARASNCKNVPGLQFRCDGFVEYCHETVGVSPPLPAHRGGGLFEDDSWRSLTPAALRNCLSIRYR